jgi:hypothetical protein
LSSKAISKEQTLCNTFYIAPNTTKSPQTTPLVVSTLLIGNYSSPHYGKISIFLLYLVINKSSTQPTSLSHEDAQTFFEYGAICTLLFPRPLRWSWREFWAEESGKIHP